MDDARRARWPAVRAALIALAILVGLMDGCPLPPRARVARQAPWFLPSLSAIVRVRRVALRPFRPLGDAFKVYQRWQLFPTARQRRWRLSIEGRPGPGAEWRVLYRPHDDEHQLLADRIEYRRIRGAWNPTSRGPHGAYGAFATWVARQLFLRDPELAEVRVRQEEIRILDGGEGMQPTGRFEYEVVRTRAKVMR